jgi:hypothetical protein
MSRFEWQPPAIAEELNRQSNRARLIPWHLRPLESPVGTQVTVGERIKAYKKLSNYRWDAALKRELDKILDRFNDLEYNVIEAKLEAVIRSRHQTSFAVDQFLHEVVARGAQNVFALLSHPGSGGYLHCDLGVPLWEHATWSTIVPKEMWKVVSGRDPPTIFEEPDPSTPTPEEPGASLTNGLSFQDSYLRAIRRAISEHEPDAVHDTVQRRPFGVKHLHDMFRTARRVRQSTPFARLQWTAYTTTDDIEYVLRTLQKKPEEEQILSAFGSKAAEQYMLRQQGKTYEVDLHGDLQAAEDMAFLNYQFPGSGCAVLRLIQSQHRPATKVGEEDDVEYAVPLAPEKWYKRYFSHLRKLAEEFPAMTEKDCREIITGVALARFSMLGLQDRCVLWLLDLINAARLWRNRSKMVGKNFWDVFELPSMEQLKTQGAKVDWTSGGPDSMRAHQKIDAAVAIRKMQRQFGMQGPLAIVPETVDIIPAAKNNPGEHSSALKSLPLAHWDIELLTMLDALLAK